MSSTAFELFRLTYSPDIEDIGDLWARMREIAANLISGEYQNV
jgi:hypothetical protein